ncbi:MAG: hypothetical protein ACREIC_19310, partial [Limisphaerales bacterium]
RRVRAASSPLDDYRNTGRGSPMHPPARRPRYGGGARMHPQHDGADHADSEAAAVTVNHQ